MSNATESTVSSKRAATVAIVDDEPLVLQSLGSFLRLESDYEVLTFESPREALTALESRPLDVVISDFLMPGLNGLEFLAEIKKLHADTPRILLTGYADKENAIRAINEVGLYQYLEKPWDNEQLLLILRNAIAQKGLRELLQEKIKELDRVLRHRDELSSREGEMRRELELARRLQRSLLPENLPQIAGLELATIYEPAMEIGGDFYDLVQLGEERWGVLLADATGHGIQAALSTALLKFAFASFSGSKEGPSQIMTGLNSILRRGLPEEVFVAALLVVVDGNRRRATVVNGGLPFPYLLPGKGQVPRPLACSGLFLGFAGDDLYQPGEEVTVDLAPGDRLLLYTDGVTEAADDAESFFEDAALVARLQQMQGKGCKELVSELAEAVHEFRAASADLDDLTILGIEIK